MSSYPRLSNVVRRPMVASAAASLCLAVGVTGLAVADSTASSAAPATAATANVRMADAAYTTAAQKRHERRRHDPHGRAFVHRRSHARAWVHGAAIDPDHRHHHLRIAIWHNGHRVAVIRTHHHHRYGFRARLRFGKNKFAVFARNVGKGTFRSHLHTRIVRRHHYTWAAHFHGHKRIAARMLRHHGWGRHQMRSLISLWNRESGWSTSAANSSGAYGIPQALPGSKMSSAGPNWQRNAHTQIRWGLRYIDKRYGSPNNAWAHSQSTGWY